MFIGVKNVKFIEILGVNVYIDYVVCEIIYLEVFVWKVDFEKFIDYKLKYRCVIDDFKNVRIILRGELDSRFGDDFLKFLEVKNNIKFFKVVIRILVDVVVLIKEVVWVKVMKKYYGD